MAVFVAWVLKDDVRSQEIPLSGNLMSVFIFVLKWIAPIAVMPFG
jgi:hypothetical protein